MGGTVTGVRRLESLVRKVSYGADEPGRVSGRARPPVTRAQFETVYIVEYPKLVRLLVVMGATMEEAQDAAQEAMKDFWRRFIAGEAFRSPVAYVRRAAIRFFIRRRQRDRERRSREIEGGHLTLPVYLDDELTACEDEQWVEQVLRSLTPAQRDVFKLVMDGMSRQAIGEQLGKSDVTIRQHLKNGGDLSWSTRRCPARTLGASGPDLAPGESEMGGNVGVEEGGGPVNDHDKSQDAAQPSEYARELARLPSLLEAVDRQITPEHVAQRFHELLDEIGDDGPPVPWALIDRVVAM